MLTVPENEVALGMDAAFFAQGLFRERRTTLL
jgi:hypothetical protein